VTKTRRKNSEKFKKKLIFIKVAFLKKRRFVQQNKNEQ